MKYATTILLLLLGALLVSACSNQAVYTGESFASDSPFRMRADGDVAMACESARRALLGQGYLIEGAGSDNVKGRKAYNSEDTQNTFIEMNIVCLSDASGSTLYATGVLTTYALKKSTSSASVGLRPCVPDRHVPTRSPFHPVDLFRHTYGSSQRRRHGSSSPFLSSRD